MGRRRCVSDRTWAHRRRRRRDVHRRHPRRRREGHRPSTKKVLSTPPLVRPGGGRGDAPLARARRAGRGGPRLAEVIHGTTSRRTPCSSAAARDGDLTTEGFRDVLELRRMRMPHLYDSSGRPPPLVRAAAALRGERARAADGEVLTRSTTRRARGRRPVARRRVESVAVACCTRSAPGARAAARRDPARELPGIPVSLSSEILREQQEYERTATTVVNAYVRPLMARYLDDLGRGLGRPSPLTIMQSSGGVMSADAAARAARVRDRVRPRRRRRRRARARAGARPRNVIAFDMGGTTAKASLIENGRVSRSQEYEVGAALSRVAACSRLRRADPDPDDRHRRGRRGRRHHRLARRGRRAHVGPRSAGAPPGPPATGAAARADGDRRQRRAGLHPGRAARLGDLGLARRPSAASRTSARPRSLARSRRRAVIHELANAPMMRALRAVSTEKAATRTTSC